MQVVTVLNQKGGVGKTSICHHLAGALAEGGRRVLLVDNDPQASLTAGFHGLEGMLALDPNRTLAAVYSGACPSPSRVIWPTPIAGVDLVAGSAACGAFNVPEPLRADRDTQMAIRDFLRDVAGYDVVLIDCPPNLYLASWAALAASSHLMVPVQPEDYGAQGIPAVQASYQSVLNNANPSLGVLGFVISMFSSKRAVHNGYVDVLKASYGDLVFDTLVPHLADYADAITAHLPVTKYKPRGKAAQSIRALAAEFQARLAAAEGRREVA